MYNLKDTSFIFTEIKGSVNEMRNKAMEWLDNWLSLQIKQGVKGCLIFDIDETVIEEDPRNDKEILIKPVANLYKKYRDMGVPVYFVTARPDVRGNHHETEKMLHSLGLGGYKNLFLMGKEFSGPRNYAVNKFKFTRRNEISQECGNVLARIGDMAWDSLPPPSTFKGDTNILKTIKNEQCFIIFHPKLTEVSIKLPG